MEFTEVIRRRKMHRAFTDEPLAPGTTDRLLRAASRAPSAGFSQGYSFLVLEGPDEAAPLWKMTYDVAAATEGDDPEQVTALRPAPLVIIPLACKDIYLQNYAESELNWTDLDEARWPVPYWYIDTGFTALLILLSVVDQGIGAVLFGIPPSNMAQFRAQYGVPQEWVPIGAIAIGHPDPANDPVPPPRASQRKPLDELVHRGCW
jgi:nitroreductase